jgi:hypothetical protein
MKNREHNPQTGVGLFFILLGLALLVATNDLLHLGGISHYFTWQTAMVFIGLLLLVNLKFTGGILLIAGGIWFFMEDRYFEIPEFIKTVYWPGVIILIGISFIISSAFKRKNRLS